MNRFFFLASLTFALAASPAFAQPAAPQVKNLDVFVDLPTGFAFIKMPAGWKFVGRLEADALRNLPASTLTSLLPPDDDQVQYAHPTSKSWPSGKVDVGTEG